MKTITHIALTLSASIATASAATILSTGDLNNPTGSDRGNWHYQSASLNDSGFTTSGDALTESVALQSVSFIRYSGGGATTGDIHLALLTSPTDLTSVVASSVNTIDVTNTATNAIMTWNFSGETISSSTEYFYAFYSDTSGDGTIGTGDTDADARIWNIAPAPLSGTLRNAPSGGISTTGSSAYMEINVTAVPEPSSTALLSLGALTAILRRRK
ncbi:PEP-CTERM sorting domain-containing protein [Sulfuriroseicoccus oceanibius]|uniref:PEP-CTERM sorting domain-containing protein n=1 Tax=Sulfuriroseicoccus oceanibius TaxID=2707525 RepID=A0A6B3LA47_9BACT|nr:PEP-CTERM sorting domain-containing protein [Sulfuriroseicoccus oceanibius]QQL46131.1 PEP-CTERM sorting domain-containing protein [Sulfuriroseicoccus oceanibius]